MRVLVTGSKGFIGGHLCGALLKRGDELIEIDLKDGVDILTTELADNFDKVFHLAARVEAQTENAMADAQANIIGSIRIFEKYQERVVYTSSSMINYPVFPYGISKLAAEHYARLYGAAIVRLCNIYGANGHSAIDRFRDDPEIVIRGNGQQLRTYAPVERAVDLLLAATPGSFVILRGDDLTVNEIAAMHNGKSRRYIEASRFDIMDCRQQ